MSRLKRFIELMQLMEQAFIHKLKQKNPNITESEIKLALKKWYLSRPKAELGDAQGSSGDISRFLK